MYVHYCLHNSRDEFSIFQEVSGAPELSSKTKTNESGWGKIGLNL